MYTNPRTGAWLRPLETSAERMAVERLMKPHSGKADAHVHLDFDERYDVLEGTATAELDGRRIEARACHAVEVPRGTRHVNAYNATGEDLLLRHTVTPGSEFAECFVSALGHHMEQDTVNEQGEFPDLQLFVVLHATRARS